MKSILISIKPEHCCNILNKDKILEIRTTCPAEWKKYLDGKTSIKPEPCNVCIYCTKQGRPLVYGDVQCNTGFIEKYTQTYNYSKEEIGKIWGNMQGTVIAEFILNEIDKIERDLNDWLPKNRYETTAQQLKNSCLTEEKLWGYGKGKTLYAWHIDDLKIYDTPKELSDFKKENKCHYADYEKGCCFECCTFYDLKDCDGRYSKIYKAPQSWMYVEEIGE